MKKFIYRCEQLQGFCCVQVGGVRTISAYKWHVLTNEKLNLSRYYL